MAVRKICTLKGCRASPRCEHPWWFDVMHQGKRWRMSVDRFALARGASEPIEAKQTAERVWEPKFLGEIAAGRDPRVPPTTQRAAVGLTVAEFLDLYYTNYVEDEGLRDPVTIMGRLKAIKATLGDLPVTALEKPTEGLRFKAAYRKGREVATLNRALSTLRAAINWGRFQDPPYLTTTPFHRFGVNIKVKEETKRDRRVGLQEEQALLAACSEMNGADHRYVGAPMHDRLIGAPETCCRQGEMLRIQNRHVDWEKHQTSFPAGTRRMRRTVASQSIPRHALRRFSNGANHSVRARSCSARQRGSSWRTSRPLGSLCSSSRTATTRNARNPVLASIARSSGRSTCTGTTSVTRVPVGLLSDGVDIRTIQLMPGHADIKQTQRYLNITDEELRKAMTGVWERRLQLRAVGPLS